jgi:hypothetical protein
LSDTNFPDEPALRPIPEFCRKYRVSRDYVYDRIRDGVLVGVKVGPRTHITGPSEKSWLRNLPRLPRRNQSAA